MLATVDRAGYISAEMGRGRPSRGRVPSLGSIAMTAEPWHRAFSVQYVLPKPVTLGWLRMRHSHRQHRSALLPPTRGNSVGRGQSRAASTPRRLREAAADEIASYIASPGRVPGLPRRGAARAAARVSRGPSAARPRRHLPRGRLDQGRVPAVRPVGDLRAGRGPLALAQEEVGLLVAELRPPPRLPQAGRVRRALPAGQVAGDQPAARRRSAAAASTVHTVGPAHRDGGGRRAADEEAGRRRLAATYVAEHEAFRLLRVRLPGCPSDRRRMPRRRHRRTLLACRRAIAAALHQ